MCVCVVAAHTFKSKVRAFYFRACVCVCVVVAVAVAVDLRFQIIQFHLKEKLIKRENCLFLKEFILSGVAIYKYNIYRKDLKLLYNVLTDGCIGYERVRIITYMARSVRHFRLVTLPTARPTHPSYRSYIYIYI